MVDHKSQMIEELHLDDADMATFNVYFNRSLRTMNQILRSSDKDINEKKAMVEALQVSYKDTLRGILNGRQYAIYEKYFEKIKARDIVHQEVRDYYNAGPKSRLEKIKKKFFRKVKKKDRERMAEITKISKKPIAYLRSLPLEERKHVDFKAIDREFIDLLDKYDKPLTKALNKIAKERIQWYDDWILRYPIVGSIDREEIIKMQSKDYPFKTRMKQDFIMGRCQLEIL